MKSKNIKYRLNTWIVSIVAIAAIILVNAIFTGVEQKLPLKIDLTEAKQFEMSAETKNVMKKIDKDVKISVLATEDSVSPIINEYMDKYKAMSKKITVEYIDVYKNQTLLYTYQSKGENVSSGDLIVECGEQYKIIQSASLYSNPMSLGEDEQLYSFDLETKLTNSIVTVTGMMKESAIYFLEGHGEGETAALKMSLDTLGYKNETANIINKEIPEDAKLLVTVTPSGDFTEDECEKIDKFLEKGGNLLAIYTPGMPKLERFSRYLEEWGIIPNNDIVVENDSEKIVQSPVIMLTDLKEHDITKALIDEELSPMFAGTSSFSLKDSNTQRATVTSIVESGPKSIGKANPESNSTEYEEGDLKGPLTLAAVAERKDNEISRVMVLGSVATMEVAEISGTKANAQFFTNAVTWLTNNQTNLKISSKIITEGKITSLTQASMLVLYYTFVIVLPILILVAGIVIWLRRRYL